MADSWIDRRLATVRQDLYDAARCCERCFDEEWASAAEEIRALYALASERKVP